MKPDWKFAVALICLLVQTVVAEACTIFVIVRDGRVLFCNNEDFTKPGFIWFTPASQGKFGRVNVGFSDSFAQGSMNEMGLAFDSNALPKIPWVADATKETPRNLIEQIMNECRTVKQAIEYFERYNCRHLEAGQFLFADADGDAAVISWLPEKGLSVTRINSDRLISTNTRLEASGYRCPRFVKVQQTLAKSTAFELHDLASALDAVHQHGPGGFTSYSDIFDLKTGKIYLYNLANYGEPIELDLREELAKNETTLRPLASLFKNSPTLEEIRAGEQRVDFDTRIVLADQELDKFAGTYIPEGNPDVKIHVTRGSGVLHVDTAGQPTAELFPESENRFRIAPDRGQVTFSLDEHDSQRVTGMILHKGRDLPAVRVD